MTSQSSRTALVTGASGGIGRAVAQRLAKDGFNLVVHYAGNPSKAEELVAEITKGGTKAVAIRADVASAAEVESLFKSSLAQFGKSMRLCISLGSCHCFQSQAETWNRSTR